MSDFCGTCGRRDGMHEMWCKENRAPSIDPLELRPGHVHWVGDPPKPSARSDDPTEHPLYDHLMAAIEQAMFGKGERHGGATVPFLDQPIFHYAKMHGRGFLTGQAAKKLEEAASTRTGAAFRMEVLGAIVYAAAALIHEEGQNNG